jgi:hypothetical protein
MNIVGKLGVYTTRSFAAKCNSCKVITITILADEDFKKVEIVSDIGYYMSVSSANHLTTVIFQLIGASGHIDEEWFRSHGWSYGEEDE